jgi:hypothetical protein
MENKLRLPRSAEKINTNHVEIIAPRVIEAAIASVKYKRGPNGPPTR